MKRHYNDDDLERALFALDLEEPPADLRDSILARTIYRVPASASVRPWEIWLYGAMCAALVWLLFFVLRGDAHHAVTTAADYGHQTAQRIRTAVGPDLDRARRRRNALDFSDGIVARPEYAAKQTASREPSRG